MTAQQTAIPVDQLLTLVDELIDVVSVENAALSRGTPAALTMTVGRKISLGLELERCVGQLRNGARLDVGIRPELGVELAARGHELKAVMVENTDRLRHSMVSTRRRIDAVMRALREQEARPGTYGVQGQRQPVIFPKTSGRMA